MHNPNRSLPAAILMFFFCTTLLAQGRGEISGRVLREDGSGLGGVTVVLNELAQATLTDAQGRYHFAGVPAGEYSLGYSLGDRSDSASNIVVSEGATTSNDHTVNWQVTFAETLTVVSASRRAERIVDAPAAVTVISTDEIERDAATGLMPKLLEFAPGVELTQGGLYDFNVNTRGFNSSLTRRVQVQIDGRDPSIPFLGSQEWTTSSLPLDDIETMEMVRGPSAALYGSNASSGAINIVTKAPRGSEGGMVRLTGGELSTLNGDFRWAAGLGGDWYLKVLGGYRAGDTFTKSRRGAAEYSVPCVGGQRLDCLPQEAARLARDDVDGYAATLRLDKYIGSSMALSLEAGDSSLEGAVLQTNIGRVQGLDVNRPYYRLNLNHPRWNFLLSRTERDAAKQLALSAAVNLVLESERTAGEFQGNWEFSDKTRLVAGASYKEEKVDTFDPNRGLQTLMFAPAEANFTAAFGQFDWNLSGRIKLVLAGRWDDSDTFYDNEFSPKAALVFSLTDDDSLRVTYNEGFQSPNYSEKFLQVDAALPINLAAIEAGLCTPFAVSCGFNRPVRVLGVGNPNLGIEEVKAVEVGYTGIFGGKAFFTADYYNTRNENFITDLIPTAGTPLGRFNTVFAPYAPPAGHPAPAILLATLARALGPSFSLLSNNFDGSPILAAASYGSFGKVDTQGVDLAVSYYLNSFLTLSANYSWFDFDIKEDLPGLSNLLSPNSPENQIRAGVAYSRDRFGCSVSGRWVDGFFWATGPFNSAVPSYSVFDIDGRYRLTDNLELSINVSNATDEVHFEAFGGDLISRRALASLTFNW